MSQGRLQQGLDRLRATSGQRRVLVVTAIVSAVVASFVAGAGPTPPLVWIVVVVSAVAAAMAPDTHTGLFVVAIVVWQWLAAVDDVASVRSLGVAIALFVFHSLLALMAVTPGTAAIHRDVLIRWLRRGGWVNAGTVAVWALVAVFEGRNAPGSATLTATGMVVTAAAILVLRHRSLAPQGEDTT